MPITEAQKEQRMKHLGSSDMAAILGVDPYRNAYDVWLEKTGKLTELEPNAAMEAGTMFENGVLEWAEGQLGKLIKNQYRSAKGLPLGSNIDALLVNDGEPVEAKTAGLFGPLKQGWGEAGTDQVPDATIIQTHTQMLCVDKEICHVAAFLGGRGFQLFQIPEDKEIRQMIAEEAIKFWNKFVQTDTPPDDVIPAMEVIKRIRRTPETTVEITDDVVTAWLAAKEVLKDASTAKKEAEKVLLAALGTAEAGKCGLGDVTYLEQSRKGYEVNATKFRVLRLKKKKEK